jgi:hypothetical protein
MIKMATMVAWYEVSQAAPGYHSKRMHRNSTDCNGIFHSVTCLESGIDVDSVFCAVIVDLVTWKLLFSGNSFMRTLTSNATYYLPSTYKYKVVLRTESKKKEYGCQIACWKNETPLSYGVPLPPPPTFPRRDGGGTVLLKF